jgi:hypothetical integral membrane protein (TIGR02206 family)
VVVAQHVSAQNGNTVPVELGVLMDHISAQQEFTAYGPSHWTVLAILAIGAALLISLGRRQSEARARVLSRAMATLILAMLCAALAYDLRHPTVSGLVPLQLCDLAELVTAYALWTQRRWAYVLLYYWGLALSTQALLTPDLGAPDFPGHVFLSFFALHLLTVWSAVYLTWGRGMRPTWRSYRFAVITTLTWMAFTIAFNTVAGTNFGYLNGKPPTTSLLDLFGPWPMYLLTEIAVVAIVWALMTWPWERTRRRASVPTDQDAEPPGLARGH